MKRNYIEINFPMYVLEYHKGEREEVITELAKEKMTPVGIEYHPNSEREINEALRILFPGDEVEIDWRDPTTVWIWPNGMMAQFSE